MNNIEKFIKENRKVFDSEKPRADHFELFEIKMNGLQKPKLLFGQLFSLAKLAAVFLVLVALGTLLFYSISWNKNLPAMTTDNDLGKVEWYYDRLKQEKLSIIESASQKGLLSQDLRNDIFRQAEAFDEEHEKLKTALDVSERVRNELILNSKLFIDRLDMIVNMLQQNN